MMTPYDPQFWLLSLGLPIIVTVGAYLLVLQHERMRKRDG